MLLRPPAASYRLIAHDLGRIMAVVAAAGAFPMVWAIARREWHSAGALLLMMGIGLLLAGAAEWLSSERNGTIAWSHGMVVVALAWLLVPALGALPLYLSHHYGTVLDAYFDAMSGLTTTGLAVISDVDHLPVSINVWRHTLQFLGGQGIVLAALTFFSASGALSLFQAEGREERIFPSVGTTARFIWLVSISHAVVGITILTIDGIVVQGFHAWRSLLHATTVFMAAFDTGGFSPQSTSIAYYHSPIFEMMVAVLMVAGAMSFGLHHALWNRRKNLGANLEIRTILATFAITLFVTMAGLAAADVFDGTLGLTRRGFFQVLSAHTGTGFATVSSAELARWGGLAFAGMTVAMALGGMSSSTAGGVKSLRVGLTIRSLFDTVREVLLPERTVVPNTFQQYGQQQLTPRLGQSVMTVSLLFVALYLFGAAVAIAYGYDLQSALFESVSASAAVGLSVGVTSPDMPALLQIVMIFQMWIGRLEFVAVFALLGFVVSSVWGD
ncbi:MAG TPA: potassium transporter TrkG [Acidimicrobiia bacterium]